MPWDQAVKEALRSLSQRVSPHMAEVVVASTLCLVSKALTLHVTEGARRDWTLPDQPHDRDEGPVEIEGMRPYWLPQGVCNDLTTDGLVVLTGPNTSGKSTVARSLCAVALLANCGLLVPAAQAKLPKLDAFFLRAASYDVPTEGLSSFAVEMLDVATLLRDATSRTMVVVDELGRGTETAAGAAIAGAVLEELCRRRSLGVFTTHLHEIFAHPLELPDGAVDYFQMTVAGGPHAWKPTWCLIPGRCSDSLAIDAAASCGVPAQIIDRAWELTTATTTSVEPAESRASCQKLPLPGVEEVLHQEVMRMARDRSPGSGEIIDDWIMVTNIEPDEVPSPHVARHGASCVYVLQTTDGAMYVGETDDLVSRLMQHRRVPDFQQASCAYVTLGDATGSRHLLHGKTDARTLEARVIRRMAIEGFPLLSTHDARGSRR